MPSKPLIHLFLALLSLAPALTAQSAWTLMSARPLPGPAGRSHAHIATDGAKLYLFGGRYGSPAVFSPHLSDELWMFDGTSWLPLPSGPPARENGTFAFRPDTGLGKLVLFGGRDVNQALLGDTWEYDIGLRAWTRHPTAIGPAPRRHAAMVYSTPNAACLLFGGYDGLAFRGDTWLWDGRTWSRARPANAPSPRARVAMAWDFARGVAVMFGGTHAANLSTPLGAETWEWNGSDWQQIRTVTAPYTNGHSGIVDAAITYDALRRRVVMCCGTISSAAGTGYQNETWEYDGNDWLSRSAASVLEPRSGASMVYVPARRRTYLFGGFHPHCAFPSTGGSRCVDDRLFEYATNHVARFSVSTSAVGCPTSAGTEPGLTAATLPWAGTTARIDIVGVPAGSTAFAFVGPAAASLPLSASGAPGCVIRVDRAVTFPGTATSGTARVHVPIPAAASLYGTAFHVQGVVLDPRANPLGLALSARGDALIGAL